MRRLPLTVKEVRDVDTQDVGDPQQCGYARVRPSGFDVLIGGAGHAGREVHRFLRHVLAEAGDADAVADGPALLKEPGVVIGQVRHSTNAGPKMIIGQPGKPGLL